jgi:hypothetical protein
VSTTVRNIRTELECIRSVVAEALEPTREDLEVELLRWADELVPGVEGKDAKLRALGQLLVDRGDPVGAFLLRFVNSGYRSLG